MILSINISVSDWIQIIIAILTLIGIVVSLAISICTLKQNSQMIEETTRPNVIIYKDVIDINNPLEYIAIKNIGSSLAYINSIKFNNKKLNKLGKNPSDEVYKAFKLLNNSCLAPNQFYRIPIETKDIDFKTVSFKISYTNKIKNYNETFKIFLCQDQKISFVKETNSGNELKVISNAIQELIKRIS